MVVPCQEYTIKLTIADVGDVNLDSGVFLEAKSFGTGALDVSTSTISLDETIVEGCESGQFIIEIPRGAPFDIPLDVNILGTAINGVDYEEISADDFIIQTGNTSVTIDIVPLMDTEIEDLESIILDVALNPCTRDTFSIFIKEDELLMNNLEDVSICAGTSITLDGSSPTIIPEAKSFTNSTPLVIEPALQAVTSCIEVSDVLPRILGPGVIESICINAEHSWLDDLDIYLRTPNGAILELTTDNGANGDDYVNTCFTTTATTVISNPGPVAPASEAPFTGQWLPEGLWLDVWGSPTNGTWKLIVTDDAMGFTGTLLDWSINFAQTYDISYNWTSEDELDCTDCPMIDVAPEDTTTYVLSTTDTYGCEILDSITVMPIFELAPPAITCGEITSSTIQFLWGLVDGATSYQVNINGAGWVNPNGIAEDHIVSGLDLNEIVVIEVRAIGPCGESSTTFSCQTPPCIVPTLMGLNASPTSCFDGEDGTVLIEMEGGVPPYTYTLGAQQNTTGLFTDLTAGLYEIIITDAVDCVQTVPAVIGQPSALEIEGLVLENISCNGLSDGVSTAIVSGGSPPYRFEWDGFGGDSIQTGLSAGLHTVQIIDDNGCTISDMVDITELAPLSIGTDSTPVSCFGLPDGTALVSPLGGAGNYTYQWDENAASQTGIEATNLVAGIYTVTITDDNLCTSTVSVEVTEPTELMSDIAGTDPLCNGGSDGTVSVEGMGGTPNYQFLWNDPNASTTATVENLGTGTYEVTIQVVLH